MVYLSIIIVMKKAQQLRRCFNDVYSFPLGGLVEWRAWKEEGATVTLSESFFFFFFFEGLRSHFVSVFEGNKELTRCLGDLTA